MEIKNENTGNTKNMKVRNRWKLGNGSGIKLTDLWIDQNPSTHIIGTA